MTQKKIIIGIGLLITFGIISLIWRELNQNDIANKIKSKKQTLAQTPRTIQIETAKYVQINNLKTFPGTVLASKKSHLSFRIGGPLVQVNVKLGVPVKKGTLLMQIDQRDFKDSINSLNAQLQGAEALLKNALADFQRAKKLFQKKVIAQTNYDKAISILKLRKSTVKNLQVQLDIAQHHLEDTTLYAPYDGTVTAQLVQNYEMVAPGRTVLIFHNIQELEVTINIPEKEIISRNINKNSLVQVKFAALEGLSIPARLKEWGSLADSTTKTYPITFAFSAPKQYKILPGMSTSVIWNDQQQPKKQLTVPISALNADNNKSTIWIYNTATQKAVARPVTLGALYKTNRIIITNGLKEGETFVITGTRLINKNDILTLKKDTH